MFYCSTVSASSICTAEVQIFEPQCILLHFDTCLWDLVVLKCKCKCPPSIMLPCKDSFQESQLIARITETMQTITYGGYYNLMARQLTLSASFLKNRIRSGPMSAFTTLFAVFTVVFAFLVGADVNFELLRNSLTFECRNPQLPGIDQT